MDSDDKKITQLPIVTSLSDSDLLVTVVNIGTAPQTKAIAKSNAVTGGLTVTAASVTASNVTGVEGTLHNLDVSGMTANRDFNLPTPSAAGKRIGVRLSTGDNTYSLIVKINSVEWGRMYLTDEAVFFVSTGTGGSNWAVEQDGRFTSTEKIIGQKRLSLTSNNPVTTSDVTAATTVYWTDGNTNLSVSVPATTTTPFDVFYSISGKTLSTTNWTNDTTRATALARDPYGRYIKSGDFDKLYLGTGRTTGSSGQCEDSGTKRFLWNLYNKELKASSFNGCTVAHTYTTATWREINGGSSVTRFEFVVGLASAFLAAGIAYAYSSSGTTAGNLGVGVDTTTGVTHQFNSERSQGAVATTDAFSIPIAAVADGYHYVTFVQYGSSANFYFSNMLWRPSVWM